MRDIKNTQLSNNELEYLQKKIHYANEMKSSIKKFIEGKATINELKKSMEDYLNVPEIEENHSNYYMRPPQYINIEPSINNITLEQIEALNRMHKGISDY